MPALYTICRRARHEKSRFNPNHTRRAVGVFRTLVRPLALCLLLASHFSSTPGAAAAETLEKGRVITLALNGKTILAPNVKDAEIFRLLMRADIEVMLNHNWRAYGAEGDKLRSLLKKYLKSGFLTEVAKPTRAKVTQIVTDSGSSYPTLYEIEALEGPFKGRRFGYSFDYDRRMPLLYEEAYIYFKGKDHKVRPAILAFSLLDYKAYMTALDSGDTDHIQALKSLKRIWEVPINSLGRIVEKDDDIVYTRIEILGGPMKGRKGWGAVFGVNRAQALKGAKRGPAIY